MNLFCRSFIATALVLFVINFSEEDRVTNSCSHSDDGRPTPSNHQRRKRLSAGNEVKEGEYPYVVFLKAMFRPNILSEINCEERICTGTLVHKRFVLTTAYCVFGASRTKVLIFSNTRPYDKIKENMTYLISESVTQEISDKGLQGNVALIKMNSTFPNVEEFPKIWDVDLIPWATELKDCVTVGFGLVGRNYSTTLPPTDLVRPMMYYLKTTLSFSNCTVNPKFGHKSFVKFHNQTYACDLSSPKGVSTLCEYGDEGSPLLCPNQTTTEKLSKVQEMSYTIYGLADVVPRKERCDANPADKQTVLFVYLYRSYAWIHEVLDAFNRSQELENDNVTTTVKTKKTTTTSYSTTSRSTIKLPEYYDTDDYDIVKKKPMRRCEGAGLRGQDVRGSSLVVHNRVLAEDAPSSVAANAGPTRWCARGASAAVASCVYYYFHHYNDLPVPPLPRQYV